MLDFVLSYRILSFFRKDVLYSLYTAFSRIHRYIYFPSSTDSLSLFNSYFYTGGGILYSFPLPGSSSLICTLFHNSFRPSNSPFLGCFCGSC